MKIVFYFVSICLLLSLGVALAPQEKRVCADFHSQEEAQKLFNENPAKYKNLDWNKNGFPCETYEYKK